MDSTTRNRPDATHEATKPVAAPPTYKTCTHCGTPFVRAMRKDSSFCCNGCEYVFNLIQNSGLQHYYDLRDKRITPVQNAALHPRDYSWLETRVAEAESSAGSHVEMLLDLAGISCVGCVWLIEKIFRDQPGAIRIEINTQYGQVLLRWHKGLFAAVDFAREIQQFGYVLGPPGQRPQAESRQLLGKLGICGAFALNTMLFTLPRYLGMEPDFVMAPLFELLALLFATLSLLTGGRYFILRGFRSIQRGVLHIDLPIATGIIVAYAGSLLGWQIEDPRFLYFDFVAIFIFLMLCGRWVQERALENNRNRLLSKNKAPESVLIIGDDLSSEKSAALDALKVGNRIRILPGEVVPVMAELESREAALSLEWINGESEMRPFCKGQTIPSGAQNIGIDPLLLTARQTWRDSLLHRLLSARQEESRNRFADQFLRGYLMVVLIIAALGGLYWILWQGNITTALQVVISVLIVSCPCAIGVAMPLAQEWAVLYLRRAGVFVRSAGLFSKLQQVRHLILDKTGTLTMEAPELLNPEVLAGLHAADRTLLNEMVRQSLHPVSRSLREHLLNLPPETTDLPSDLTMREEIGYGLVATSGSSTWTLGRPGWRADSTDDSHGTAQAPPEGNCELRRNGHLLASFRFGDAIREDARRTIQTLANSFSIAVLSGDRHSKVIAIAKLLGLPETAAISEQSPEEKAAHVQKLSQSGGVFFIGDGANDALAFEQATVRGTPATPHGLLQDEADFFFTGRSMAGIIELLRMQKLRRKALHRIFTVAIAYNIAVVIIALMGLMHPLLAAILMPLSSLATIFIVAITYRPLSRNI